MAKKNPKSKSLFDHLKVVTSKQPKNYFDKLSEGDKKNWSNYMINRFLSMEKDYIEVVNLIQQYQLEPEHLYRFYIDILPKRYVYFDYIKSKKEIPYPDEMIDIFSQHFYISTDEAVEYLDILTGEDNVEEISTICQMYGIKEDKLKKWIDKIT